MKRSGRDCGSPLRRSTLVLGAVFGSLAALGCERAAWQEGEATEDVDSVEEAIRGGTVVTGAVGVVDFGGCTGA